MAHPGPYWSRDREHWFQSMGNSNDGRKGPAMDTTKPQADLKMLDDRLSREFREPPMSEILSVLATHNREKAMRLRHPQTPLVEGSRVCIEAWGTVCSKTAGGEAMIVLDSDSHRGVIFAPQDTELCQMARKDLTTGDLAEMTAKARKVQRATKAFVDNVSSPDAAGAFTVKSEPGRGPYSSGQSRRGGDRGECLLGAMSGARGASRAGFSASDQGPTRGVDHSAMRPSKKRKESY